MVDSVILVDHGRNRELQLEKQGLGETQLQSCFVQVSASLSFSVFVCAVVHLFVRWLLGLLVVWLVFVLTPMQYSDIAPGSSQFEAALRNPWFGFRPRTSLLGSACGSWWLRAQELGSGS